MPEGIAKDGQQQWQGDILEYAPAACAHILGRFFQKRINIGQQTLQRQTDNREEGHDLNDLNAAHIIDIGILDVKFTLAYLLYKEATLPYITKSSKEMCFLGYSLK